MLSQIDDIEFRSIDSFFFKSLRTMRSFLTLFSLLVCFLPTLASPSALKGVRGSSKRLRPTVRVLKDKKCKKFAPAPKADPKAAKEGVAAPEPKAKEAASAPAPKAAKEAGAAPEPKAAKEGAPAPKATAAEPKELKVKEAEPECLEWEEESDREDDGSGAEVVTDPTMGSTSTSTDFQSVNVDCDAIANDAGPTDTHSVSFSVNIDLLKDADSSLQSIYSAMEKELQSKVAPRVAGCSGGRMLAEESTKIVNVDFGEFEFDNRGRNRLAVHLNSIDFFLFLSPVQHSLSFHFDCFDNDRM